MRSINSYTKKKVFAACAAGITAAAIVTNVCYVKAKAPGAIRSKGNLAFDNGSFMALYSADIQYLREELDDLFGELPPFYNNNNDSLTEEQVYREE